MLDHALERHTGLDSHIDTNRINVRQKLATMNRLETWERNGVIGIGKDDTVEGELAPYPPGAEKARRFPTWLTFIEPLHEESRRREIQQALFPGGLANDNDRRDVLIVYNAAKCGAILVTADGGSKSQPGGILGARDRLAAIGIRIMTDSEAVTHVEETIRIRDNCVRDFARRTGKPVPPWVGKD